LHRELLTADVLGFSCPASPILSVSDIRLAKIEYPGRIERHHAGIAKPRGHEGEVEMIYVIY
jgi:hypothetical protein